MPPEEKATVACKIPDSKSNLMRDALRRAYLVKHWRAESIRLYLGSLCHLDELKNCAELVANGK